MLRPVPQTVQSAHIPAPLGGTNTVNPGSAMPTTDCIYQYNLIAGEYGLRTRPGYTEQATGLTGALENLVRTELPFTGSAKSGSKDRLFACTSTGIWDVTDPLAVTQEIVFSDQSLDAGYGISHVVVTAGGHFLLYCDEANGLFTYTESTDTWTQVTMGSDPATQIAGVDPATFCFVTVFKNRVWFVARDTAKAWYLSAGAIYGTAAAFDFGTKFKAGGPLVGLWNWTYDGGAGLDDSLVAISQGGDVAVYQGTDPASATTFGLKGVWFVGAVPYGRRIATDYGGDLLVMSSLGVQPMSKLVLGATGEKLYTTWKISNLFNRLASIYRTVRGWAIHIHPADNALMILIPTGGPEAATTQLVMSFASGGWGQYRDLPIVSACVWTGDLYFGTTDGRVCINRGDVDNQLLSDSESFDSIGWSLLTAFQNLGNARQKKVEMIRPTLLSQTPNASVECTARYGYNFLEPSAPSGTGGGGDGAWDSSTWDSTVWGGDFTPTQSIKGATGLGREVAIAVRGNSISRTTLVGIDVFFNQGGFL